MKTFAVAFFLTLAFTPCGASPANAPLYIPASTAYSEPEPESIRIEQDGAHDWSRASQSLVWYGKIAKPGRLEIQVRLRLPASVGSLFRLIVDRESRQAAVAGTANGGPTTVDFGAIEVRSAGYHRFALQGLGKSGPSFGDIESLVLGGPAAQGARFNTSAEQRGAPSVHLRFPLPPGARAAWFYSEVTAKTDPLWSYYMACGWHRGYFGMQVNGPAERRIIFSVWDSGKESVDRSSVRDEDRVKLLAKGEGVVAESFGNEGTGGHSHLVYPWKTGGPYRFLVTAQPDGTATIYSGYFYFPERHGWGLIARFRAPKDGEYLHGLYSFDEDWNSANGQRKRLAEFGAQWIRSPEGAWTELTRAVFSHTGKDYRADYDAGASGGRFALAGGGFADGTIRANDTISRTSGGKPPRDIVLDR